MNQTSRDASCREATSIADSLEVLDHVACMLERALQLRAGGNHAQATVIAEQAYILLLKMQPIPHQTTAKALRACRKMLRLQ